MKNLSAYNNPDGINGILAWTTVPITDANDGLTGRAADESRSDEYRDFARIDIGNAIAAIEGQVAIQYLLDRGIFDIIDSNDDELITAPELQTFVDNSATIGLPEAGAMARLLGGTARSPRRSPPSTSQAEQPDVLQRRFNFFDYASDGSSTAWSRSTSQAAGAQPAPAARPVHDRRSPAASANGFFSTRSARNSRNCNTSSRTTSSSPRATWPGTGTFRRGSRGQPRCQPTPELSVLPGL